MGVVSRSQRQLGDVAVSGRLVPAWNTSDIFIPLPAGISDSVLVCVLAGVQGAG
jgi:hypothetical protein